MIHKVTNSRNRYAMWRCSFTQGRYDLPYRLPSCVCLSGFSIKCDFGCHDVKDFSDSASRSRSWRVSCRQICCASTHTYSLKKDVCFVYMNGCEWCINSNLKGSIVWLHVYSRIWLWVDQMWPSANRRDAPHSQNHACTAFCMCIILWVYSHTYGLFGHIHTQTFLPQLKFAYMRIRTLELAYSRKHKSAALRCRDYARSRLRGGSIRHLGGICWRSGRARARLTNGESLEMINHPNESGKEHIAWICLSLCGHHTVASSRRAPNPFLSAPHSAAIYMYLYL